MTAPSVFASLLVALLVLPASAIAQSTTTRPSPPPAQRPSDPDRPRTTPPDADDRESEPDKDDAIRPARRGTQPGPRRGPTVRARVSGLVGFQSFTAADSFDAVLDTSSGVVFGGGGGILFGRNLFVDVQVTRFSADGTRVFITDAGEVFDLGVDAQVAVTPIDVSVGWRFAGTPRPGPRGRPRFRAVPYVGGGVGVQFYRETSEFADAGDDVDETHGSYHVLGGVELPFTPHVGASVDVLYRWVPDAIGTNGVSSHFGETDLGGAQVRVKVTYTF